jgi:hypothetical protein
MPIRDESLAKLQRCCARVGEAEQGIYYFAIRWYFQVVHVRLLHYLVTSKRFATL